MSIKWIVIRYDGLIGNREWRLEVFAILSDIWFETPSIEWWWDERESVLEDLRKWVYRNLIGWIPSDDNRGISISIYNRMITLKNHWTDTPKAESISFEFSQWRKIYSFIISFRITSHCQWVPVIVGFTANRLLIIITITFKRTFTK